MRGSYIPVKQILVNQGVGVTLVFVFLEQFLGSFGFIFDSTFRGHFLGATFGLVLYILNNFWTFKVILTQQAVLLILFYAYDF